MNYQTLENSKLYNEDIKTVCYYLISLYYKTNKKYKCYRTKLNRLLIIYKLCGMKYNVSCLEGIYTINAPTKHIGLWFRPIASFTFREIYWEFNEKEEDKQEIIDQFNESAPIPNIYRLESLKISENTKELLEMIFRKFGNYTINDLANMIDEIIIKIPITTNNNEYKIDILNYDKFLSNNIDNEVFEFIKNFQKNEFTNNNKVKKLKNSKIY